MATLQVTNLQNTAATVTNVSLLADGTTTLVLNATGTSRTGGLRYNAGTLEVYTSGGIWVAAGGGSGTVTSVTATLPISVLTGTTTPLVSINLGLGTVVNGSNIAVSIPVASTPPGIGTGATQGLNGSMYWDDTLGQLFIRYINGGAPVWVAAAPPAGGGGAGTVTTVTGTAPIAVATGTTTPVVSITPGTARQLMQTNAGGTAAEFASNIDVPGTLDVTGVGTFDANLRFNSGYGSAAVAYGCRAWVNFDGTVASPTIRGSGNVSGVTKAATGDYTVTFATPMPDTNYTVILTCGLATDGSVVVANVGDFLTARTTTSVRVLCGKPGIGSLDTAVYEVSVFR